MILDRLLVLKRENSGKSARGSTPRAGLQGRHVWAASTKGDGHRSDSVTGSERRGGAVG